MVQIMDFRYNPTLRRMLINYSVRTYEDNAILNDENLIDEYYHLKKNNELHLLFEEEYLINYYKDGIDRG